MQTGEGDTLGPFVVVTMHILLQVQAVVQDFRCHELMSMLEQQRGRDAEAHASGSGLAIQDVIRYRRQAEALLGSDENLFRIDWVRAHQMPFFFFRSDP